MCWGAVGAGRAPELGWEGGRETGRSQGARSQIQSTGDQGVGCVPQANGRLWEAQGSLTLRGRRGPGQGLEQGVGEGSAVAGPWGSRRPLRLL